jgi:hypothetical protein
LLNISRNNPTVSVIGGREGKHHDIDDVLFSDFAVLQVCMEIK